MERMNLTPKWEAAMRILIVVLEDGTEKGKAAAKEELMHLARMLDHANAHEKAGHSNLVQRLYPIINEDQ
jgi:hypothetical protein